VVLSWERAGGWRDGADDGWLRGFVMMPDNWTVSVG